MAVASESVSRPEIVDQKHGVYLIAAEIKLCKDVDDIRFYSLIYNQFSYLRLTFIVPVNQLNIAKILKLYIIVFVV